MRLQLTRAGALVIASLPVAVSADDVDVRSKVSLYADDDATTVISPRSRVTGQVAEDWAVSAGWAADVTTSASVDVVTSATPRSRAWEEMRNEASVSLEATPGDASASAGAVYSAEADWESLGLGAGGSLELLEKNLVLSARGGVSLERVGRAKDSTFERPLTVGAGELGVTQVLSPSAIASISYTLLAAQGYLQSPYRYVPISLPASVVVVPESHPTTRLRHAIAVRANQHVLRDAAVGADYRLYVDDWGVVSHTVGVRWLVQITRAWRLRLRARGYLQSGASFYRDDYATDDGVLPLFVSRDRELSDLAGALAGAKVAWSTPLSGGLLELDAKTDVFRYDYPDYSELPARTGWVAEAGLTLGW